MPEFIRISRDQYDDLLTHLDGVAEREPELAQGLRDKLQHWCPQPQVDGQLELPLQWDENHAGR